MITKSAKAAGIAPPQGNLSGRDAMIEELRYAQSDEGKAEKAKKKAEAAAKKEAKKLEKETAPSQQSTTDFLNMSFTPPKKDIVQMLAFTFFACPVILF